MKDNVQYFEQQKDRHVKKKKDSGFSYVNKIKNQAAWSKYVKTILLIILNICNMAPD